MQYLNVPENPKIWTTIQVVVTNMLISIQRLKALIVIVSCKAPEVVSTPANQVKEINGFRICERIK